MRIFQLRYSITTLLFAVLLSGCNIISDVVDVVLGEEKPRGGVGAVYYDAATVAGNEVSSAINTRRTNQELQQDTVIAQNSDEKTYNSLTEAAFDASNQLDERLFMLQGLVVQREGVVEVTASGELGWNNDSSTNNDIVRVTSPAVSLTFNKNGEISAVTAYFVDKEYVATGISGNAFTLTGTIDGSQYGYNVNGSNIAEITANRSNSFFGFNSNYMVHVGWNVVQQRTATTAYNVTGNMLAGIETNSIPTNNIYIASPNRTSSAIRFTGKGHGTYGDAGSSYATRFDMRADINFASNLITLASTNTIRCQSGASSLNCGNSSDASQLNFTTSLGAVPYTGNNVFGVVGTEDLLGFVDARFYGLSAREFGGTFILKGRGVEYYYGAFGTERAGIVIASAFNNAIAPSNNSSSNDSATDNSDSTPMAEDNVAFSEAMEEITGLKTLSVYRDNRDIYTRPPDRLWSNADVQKVVTVAKSNSYSASLTFNDDGHISEVTTNFINEDADISAVPLGLHQNYTVMGQVNPDNKALSSENLTGSTKVNGVSIVLDADRKNVFGLVDNNVANYMAHISWHLAAEAALDPNPAIRKTHLVDNSYNIHGSMIAGIETSDLADIVANELVEFEGKGRGTYGHINGSYDTVFDVTAEVDFTLNEVTFETTDTACRVVDCASDDFLSQLNLITSTIEYTGNAISGDITTNDSRLSGILDARFYGLSAREFGGVFALANKSNYYYGAFGAERFGIATSSPLNTGAIGTAVSVDTPIDASKSYVSLTALAKSGDASAFIMNGLSVYKDNTITYRRAPNRSWRASDGTVNADTNSELRIARLAGAGAAISFAGTAIDATLYTHDASINESATTSVDRSTIFGYGNDDAANYMAYISWRSRKDVGATDIGLTASAYDNVGMMIVGVETDDLTPITADSVTFSGRGFGTYGNVDGSSYDTVFDVMAEIDFTDSEVVIETLNTECKVAGCTNDSFLRQLNLVTGVIGITANASSGDVATDDNSNNLSGTLDARFYGGDAWEFGGTFALADNSSNYYYGAFGAERKGIATSLPLNKDAIDVALSLATPIVASESYDSLTFLASDGDGSPFTMKSLSVYKDDTVKYRRAPNRDWIASDATVNADTKREIRIARLGGAGASLSFDNGNIASVTTYLNGNVYTATIANPESGINIVAAPITLRNGEALTHADNSNFNVNGATISVDRGVAFFGFASNYMAHIGWNITKETDRLDGDKLVLEDEIYDISGSMIAGVETDVSDVPTEGGTNFTGKGRGTYGDLTESYDTIFDMMAMVDFSDKTIIIRSSKTCKNVTNADCKDADSAMGVALGGDRLDDELNFITDELSFASLVGDDNSAMKSFGGDVTTDVNDTDITGNTLEGTLDASFYGLSGRELGGTFAMTGNNNSYYYGVFGSERGGIALPIAFNDTILSATVALTNRKTQDVPEDNNSTPYASITEALVASGNKVFTFKGVSVYKKDTTNYNRTAFQDWEITADTEREINITRLNHSATSLTFNSDGNISEISTYLNGQTYTASGFTTSNGSTITAPINVGANTDSTSASITVDKSGAFFGFKAQDGSDADANYMTYVGWDVAKQTLSTDGNDTDDKRYSISGGMIAGIETVGQNIPVSRTTINFVGKGRGTYGDVRADKYYDTVFDVATSFDFSNYTGSFTTSDTKICLVSGCNNVFTDNTDINMSGTLRYSKNYNNITGNIISQEDNIVGTLEARFYGVAARELGGTFALTNSDYYYYGAFGSERIDGIVTASMFEENILDDIVGVSQPTMIAKKSDNITPYNSLAEAADDTGNASPKTFILPGLATYISSSSSQTRAPNRSWSAADSSQTASLNSLTGSAASLTFNKDGKISAVTVYLNGNTYSATADATALESSSGQKITAIDITQGGAAEEISTISVDRSSNFLVLVMA